MLQTLRRDFVEANAGLGLDYVYIGQWLVVNKKGQFVERDNPDVNYKDEIDVVIGMGEERYVLWGKQKSDEEGTLLIAEKTREQAEARFEEVVDTLDADANYSLEDIQSRYLASVIPVESLKEDTPTVYLMSFSQTAKLAYGKWALNLFNGKYDGFPKGTAVPAVVTRIVTIEKETPNYNYITLTFEAIELFDPETFVK